MAYVDLNPIRAKMTNTPEESDYTSVQKRLTYAKDGKQQKNCSALQACRAKLCQKGYRLNLNRP